MTGETRPVHTAAAGFPVTVGLLIRDTAGLLLIVRAARSGRWQLPGGLVETGESPRQAARRETREELGLDIEPAALLAADWIPPRTAGRRPRLALLFDGPTLTSADLGTIRPQTDELSDWLMASSHRAHRLLHPLVAERLPTRDGAPRAAPCREPPTTREATTP